MNATHPLKRVIAGGLLSGGVAVAGVGLAADTAHADGDHCSTRSGCYKGPGMRWCPGDYVWPGLRATGWDLSVCHVYHGSVLRGITAVAPTTLSGDLLHHRRLPSSLPGRSACRPSDSSASSLQSANEPFAVQVARNVVVPMRITAIVGAGLLAGTLVTASPAQAGVMVQPALSHFYPLQPSPSLPSDPRSEAEELRRQISDLDASWDSLTPEQRNQRIGGYSSRSPRWVWTPAICLRIKSRRWTQSYCRHLSIWRISSGKFRRLPRGRASSPLLARAVAGARADFSLLSGWVPSGCRARRGRSRR